MITFIFCMMTLIHSLQMLPDRLNFPTPFLTPLFVSTHFLRIWLVYINLHLLHYVYFVSFLVVGPQRWSVNFPSCLPTPLRRRTFFLHSFTTHHLHIVLFCFLWPGLKLKVNRGLCSMLSTSIDTRLTSLRWEINGLPGVCPVVVTYC